MATAPPYPARPLGYRIKRTGRLMQQRLRETVAARGYVYPVEFWPVLHHLTHAAGTLSQNRLAEHLFRDKATVARLVARMETDGYVRREADPGDARLKRVCLTGAGHALATELRAHVRAMVGAATAGVPPEDVATCKRVLDTIFDNLTALNPAPPPHPTGGAAPTAERSPGGAVS